MDCYLKASVIYFYQNINTDVLCINSLVSSKLQHVDINIKV